MLKQCQHPSAQEMFSHITPTVVLLLPVTPTLALRVARMMQEGVKCLHGGSHPTAQAVFADNMGPSLALTCCGCWMDAGRSVKG